MLLLQAFLAADHPRVGTMFMVEGGCCFRKYRLLGHLSSRLLAKILAGRASAPLFFEASAPIENVVGSGTLPIDRPNPAWQWIIFLGSSRDASP